MESKELKIKEKRNIDINQIDILEEFSNTMPKVNKIVKCYSKFKASGIWDREILVTEKLSDADEYTLVDGYVKYLVCRMFNITNVEISIVN